MMVLIEQKKTLDRLKKMSNPNSKKTQKVYKKYDKQIAKDIKTAKKEGNEKTAKTLAAGRTYMKMMMDSNFASRAMSDAASQSNVKQGQDFTYKLTRSNELGGVVININGKKNIYTTDPT